MPGEHVLVTGAAGQLGGYLVAALRNSGATVSGVGRQPGPGVDVTADIRDREQVRHAIAHTGPDIVIHAAAHTDVDGCEREPKLATDVNHLGSANVAAEAAERGIWLFGIGTDFVFSGDGGAPYTESATPAPISVYGASKLAGERAILSADPRFAVARTAWVYGGQGKHFPRTVLTMLDRNGRMEVVDDERGCPTFAGDLAEAIVALLPHRPSGILHLTNDGSTSRFELARRVAEAAGRDAALIQPVSTEVFLQTYPLPARRPADSSLANSRASALGIALPEWGEAVDRYVPRLTRELAQVP